LSDTTSTKIDIFQENIKEVNVDLDENPFTIDFKLSQEFMDYAFKDIIPQVNALVKLYILKVVGSPFYTRLNEDNYLNTTFINKPTIESVSGVSQTQEVQNYRKQELNFLSTGRTERMTSQDDTKILYMLFGLSGRFFPATKGDFNDSASATEMHYPALKDNKNYLLVNDYFWNTFLRSLQFQEKLSVAFYNDTDNGLPFNIDTDSIAKFVPEIKQHFIKNANMTLKFYMDKSEIKPVIQTNQTEIYANTYFNLDFYLISDYDQKEILFLSLGLNLVAHADLQSANDRFSITFTSFKIAALTVKFSTLGTVETVQLQTRLQLLFDVLLDKIAPTLRNLDINNILFFPVKLYDITLEKQATYLTLGFNFDVRK